MVREIVHSIGQDLPHMVLGVRSIMFNESFRDIRAEGLIMNSGYVGIQWLTREVTYAVRWSNPLWEILGKDIANQQAAIKERIEESLLNTPCPESMWSTMSEESSGDFELPPLMWVRTTAWVRWVIMCMRRYESSNQ
jgi:hypothetical protein